MEEFIIGNIGNGYPMLHLDRVEGDTYEDALATWEADEISEGYTPLWIAELGEIGTSVSPREIRPAPAPVPPLPDDRIGGNYLAGTS